MNSMVSQATPLVRDNKTTFRKLKLIDGQFENQDALEILTHMVHIKIRFHEGKIQTCSNEEDIKMRENRIRELQRNLFELREYILQQGGSVHLEDSLTLRSI